MAPRKLVRGVNQLGDIHMTQGALLVAGKFVLDPPGAKLSVSFEVEALASQQQPDGAEIWEEVENLTPVQRPDGTFEVRGDTRPVRHRLLFHGYHHLPVAPLEFRIGADDLVIPIAIGHQLSATCLLPANLPMKQLRGVLRPADEAELKDHAAPPGMARSMGLNRFHARSGETTADTLDLRWQALPAGIYVLEIRASGSKAPVAVIADVVVPPPQGGDPRLKDIDLRDKVNTRKVHVALQPKVEGSDENRQPAIVFTMPQAEPMSWNGTQVRNGVVVIATPPGPIELLAVCSGFKPKRLVTDEREVTVTLEPWPTVELTFADLPKLPDETALEVSLRATNQTPDASYSTEDGSAPLAGLLQPYRNTAEVKDGRARISIGDGTFRVTIFLLRTAGKNNGAQPLRKVTPLEIQGGSNLAPIPIQLDAAELQKVIDDLQKPPAKK